MNLFLWNCLLHTKIVIALHCLDLIWRVDRSAGGRRLRLGNSFWSPAYKWLVYRLCLESFCALTVHASALQYPVNYGPLCQCRAKKFLATRMVGLRALGIWMHIGSPGIRTTSLSMNIPILLGSRCGPSFHKESRGIIWGWEHSYGFST